MQRQFYLFVTYNHWHIKLPNITALTILSAKNTNLLEKTERLRTQSNDVNCLRTPEATSFNGELLSAV